MQIDACTRVQATSWIELEMTSHGPKRREEENENARKDSCLALDGNEP